MKRSRIGPKTYESALALKQAQDARRREKASQRPRKHSIASHEPLERKQGLLQRRRKPLKAGKKTKAWESERRKLKKRFEVAGITTCELRGSDEVRHKCGNDNYLGFAHDAKRRKLTAQDLHRVILVCNFAHDIFEVWPAEKMRALVNETIRNRATQP